MTTAASKRNGADGAPRRLREEVQALTDDGFLAWLDLFATQAVVQRELERVVEAAGLPMAFHEVLARLESSPDGGRLRMGDLARQLYVTKSGVSKLVSRMAVAGLVERQADPGNLVATWAAITPRGREVLWRTLPAFLGGVREHFSRHLDSADLAALRAALGNVLGAAGERPAPPIAVPEPPAPPLPRVPAAPDRDGAGVGGVGADRRP